MVSLLLLAQDSQDPRRDPLSPRNQLHPRTVAEITGANPSPVDRLMQQIQSLDKRSTQKLSDIQQQHMYLLQQQRELMVQMNQMLEVKSQAALNGERLNSLDRRLSTVETRVQRNEDNNDPRSIAVLETKVDAMLRTGTWLLAGVGSLLLGAITVIAKRAVQGIFRRRRT